MACERGQGAEQIGVATAIIEQHLRGRVKRAEVPYQVEYALLVFVDQTGKDVVDLAHHSSSRSELLSTGESFLLEPLRSTTVSLWNSDSDSRAPWSFK